MEDFKKKFLAEAIEHINDLESALLALETNTDDKELVERVFRAMHSLKGGGAMFGFDNVSHFTHDLETLYDMVRKGKMELTENLFSVTLKSVDHLKLLLEVGENLPDDILTIHNDLLSKISKIVNNTTTEVKETAPVNIDKKENTWYVRFSPLPNIMDNGTNPLFLVDELQQLGSSFVLPNTMNIPELSELDPEKCYIDWELVIGGEVTENAILDVFIFVDDLSKVQVHKLSSGNLFNNPKFLSDLQTRAKEQKVLGDQFRLGFQKTELINNESVANKVKKVVNNSRSETQTSNNNTSSTIRVESHKLDSLMNLVSELVTVQARLSLFSQNNANNELGTITENVQKLTRELRDIAFSIVLIPIESTIVRFQRLVRDLANELHKEIIFETHGTETELDKTIIENITDPIMHIIRNSIDHGIESPEEREQNGKPRQGKISLNAYHSGPNVIIEIKDDGKGLNFEKIRQKAYENGIISADNHLTEKEILDLIFMSGFSTAEKVTDISGRGVGMDVVKKKIVQVRGEVYINTEFGKGTMVSIKLPLTLSIIDGLLVKFATHFMFFRYLQSKKYTPSNIKELQIHTTTHYQLTENKFHFSI